MNALNRSLHWFHLRNNMTDLRRRSTVLVIWASLLFITPGIVEGATRVSIAAALWHINDTVTHPGTPAEGRLMNVRMVNATFEDRNRADFDPEANTERFIAKIPDYAACGVDAFTVCLQGGMPGYEGALNSAFHPDGTLRDDYMKRVRRVIEACDRHGVVVHAVEDECGRGEVCGPRGPVEGSERDAAR